MAEILGYSNTKKALADHVDDEDKGVTKRDTPVRPKEDEKADIILNDVGSN